MILIERLQRLEVNNDVSISKTEWEVYLLISQIAKNEMSKTAQFMLLFLIYFHEIIDLHTFTPSSTILQ